MEKGKNKISYIRKPLARRGKMALIRAAAATLLGGLGAYLAVRGNGTAGLNVAAMGFSSLLFSLVSLWYGWLAFLERNRNYLMAKISIGVSGLWAVFWVCMVIIGLRG